MASPKRHPWEQIEKEYVEGISDNEDDDLRLPNLKELSDRWDVPYQRVRERSSQNRWPDKRQAHQVEITRERQRKRALELGKNAVDFDTKSYDVAKVGINLVMVRLAEIAKEHQLRKNFREDAIQRQLAGAAVERHELYSAVNYREMESLASAADRLQSIGMRALGTDVQRHEISGPEGGPIEASANIVGELKRDDPERLAQIMSAMKDAGLFLEGDYDDEEETDIQDAEIVEDGDEENHDS